MAVRPKPCSRANRARNSTGKTHQRPVARMRAPPAMRHSNRDHSVENVGIACDNDSNAATFSSNTSAMAQTPNDPVRGSFRISKRRSGEYPPHSASAQSATPSRCRKRVRIAQTLTVAAAASSGSNVSSAACQIPPSKAPRIAPASGNAANIAPAPSACSVMPRLSGRIDRNERARKTATRHSSLKEGPSYTHGRSGLREIGVRTIVGASCLKP